MFSISKSLLASAVLGTGLLLTGCANAGNGPGGSAVAASDQGVACKKCETTWVKIPNTEKGRVVGYTNSKQMACPDCKDAVATFFATGKFEHSCKTCGPDAMVMCQGH